jgi:ABC-type lipoprotein release transport system permease subunit
LKRTKSRKTNLSSNPAEGAGLVFVVDVSSLTKKGFVGSSTYEGREVDFEFDEGSAGVFLPSEMAARLHVRKGAKVSVLLEDGPTLFVELGFSGVSKAPRISDPKVYYAIGHEGGAVLRVRRA